MSNHHVLTIAVEDYFHVAALRGAVRDAHWSRLEPRLERNLDATLELLARHSARATFFVFGRIAETQPELVRRIAEAGHEVASRGYWPRATAGMTQAEFLEDLHRARKALEAAGANRVLGYRSPTWIGPRELWKLDVLAEEGYLYDASINPKLWSFAGHPECDGVYEHRHRALSLWEFPVTTVGPSWLRLPITGGNYIRQIPHTLLRRLVAHADRHTRTPLVFYFMPWELDSDQPQIQGISALQRLRHYRNLGKARWVMEDYLSRHRFVGIADHLELAHLPLEPQVQASSDSSGRTFVTSGEPVTLVVPIYNEAKNVAYLRRTLREFRLRVAGRYRVHLLLVDDCSTDGTREALEREFGKASDCRIVRHEVNRGVAAAILTGIREAGTEVVCSIDCDCSYDPAVLEAMLPLADKADMVTASPYHPLGRVRNVPEWRLFLSKSLSHLYSAVLRERIYTYTSCCRVYRRSRMLPLELRNGGFLGTAEMLIRLKAAGGRIAEVPATLESRLLGESKMKIARTIRGHLGLLAGLIRGQAFAVKRHPAASLSLDFDNLWSYMKTHGDAGWDSYPSYLDELVPIVLERLTHHGLTITCFVVGQDAALDRNREALRELARQGHEIGNHSFSHEPWFHEYERPQVEREIALAEECIERATGQRPRGFRGPGFSLSRDTVEVLHERGYEYDASTLPTFLGPLARAYYFWTSGDMPAEERRLRSRLFGSVSDGLRPLRPYTWDGRLLEIPVTTMPVVRAPFHMSYLLFLAGYSRPAFRAYLRFALALCRATGVQPSFLLHPLDFLGGDRVKQLAFFPGMAMPTARKLELVDEVIGILGSHFRLVTLEEHARIARESGPLRSLAA